MSKLEKIYYSPRGYWKGVSAIKKLAIEAKVDEKTSKEWLMKQALWQIYLQVPKYVPRPKFSVSTPNRVHQADLLFLPHDKKGRKLYKYALTVVDVASRYKEAEPLSSKESGEVAKAFSNIYGRKGLTWPKLLQVDPGREFMGKVNDLMKKRNVSVRRGEAGNHRAQGIVERFNRTLAERLFSHQYAQEILMEARGKNVRSKEWVARLPAVVETLNNEETRLIGMKPSDAIKKKEVVAKPSKPGRVVDEKQIEYGVKVRYLYRPGELEGGERQRATDPNWSLETYGIDRVVKTLGDPILYYLTEGAPKRGFVKQELLIVPADIQLPPDGVLKLQR
jgi:hypothetical protein